MRKLAAGALAAISATSVLALARPAAADPTPLSLVGNECGLSGTGTGYDELSFWYETPTMGLRLVETTASSVAIDYGTDWVVAQGQTVELILEGYVGDTLVDSESIVVGPCNTGSSLVVTATNIGTAPAGTEYGATVHECDGFGPITAYLGGGESATVPVPPGAWCVSVGSFPIEVIGIDIKPNQVTVPANTAVPVAYNAYWTGSRVRFVEEWHMGGQVFHQPPPGVDATAFGLTWTSFDGGNPTDTDTCSYDEPDSTSMFCDGFPMLQPNGTIEAALTAPAGFTTDDTTFDESDCSFVEEFGRVWCDLLVRIDGPPIAGGGGICPSAANPFTDVTPGSTHATSVVCAAALGLVKGGPGGAPANVFGPTGTTTRGQLASLVRNLLAAGGVSTPASPPNAFGDDNGNVHESSINVLAALGVIGGNGESGADYFPNRPATRAEIASFLHRAYAQIAGAPMTAGPNVFGDDDGHPAEAAINALAAAGVIVGKGPGVFDPDATVTREQIATMLVGLVEVLDDAGAW